MHKALLFRAASLLAFVGVVSCADSIPVAPNAIASRRNVLSARDAESGVRALLASINENLAAAGADYALAKVEFLIDTAAWDGALAPEVFANDRFKGFGMEWVPGDPRRGERVGVTYAFNLRQHPRPIGRTGTGFVLIPYEVVEPELDRGVESWSTLSCTRRPVDKVNATPGVNSDYYDEFVFTHPIEPLGYEQPADIVQGGWLNPGFFDAITPQGGSFIIGITFTDAFVTPDGFGTDIDHNHLFDIRRAEIYYNRNFAYGTNHAPNVVDLFSVIAHETGHALGLNHFGRLFQLTSGAHTGSIQVSPRALMNAAYLGPISQLTTDISSYCSIFGREIK